jgi:hypothetical protein
MTDIPSEVDKILAGYASYTHVPRGLETSAELSMDAARHLITALIEREVLAAREDQMLIEADAFRKTLDLFRIKNPGAKLPRGLSLGFQTRMKHLKAAQLKGGK